MKALLEPADINTDDDGTRLALIHTDSSARQDFRYIFFLLNPMAFRSRTFPCQYNTPSSLGNTLPCLKSRDS
mgnify:CR=1 FL=1